MLVVWSSGKGPKFLTCPFLHCLIKMKFKKDANTFFEKNPIQTHLPNFIVNKFC